MCKTSDLPFLAKCDARRHQSVKFNTKSHVYRFCISTIFDIFVLKSHSITMNTNFSFEVRNVSICSFNHSLHFMFSPFIDLVCLAAYSYAISAGYINSIICHVPAANPYL